MFTLLNILNYTAGKPLSIYVLILTTFVIYYWILSNYWNSMSENKLYVGTIIILLLIDITTIVIINTISHNYDSNLNHEIVDKKVKRKKSKKSKKNKSDKKIVEPNNETKEQLNDEKDKSLISLYNPEQEVSLKTY